MANAEVENETPTDWVRFRCPEDLKKAIAHMAVDDGVPEGTICIRLLTEAVEREEKRRKRT